MKILLAVDGSAGSDAAVQQVLARPWPAGSMVKIISVIELLPLVTPENFWVPDRYYLKLEESLQAQARDAIERAESQFQKQSPALTVTTEILTGKASDTIVQEASAWQADLIVLGSHGYRGLKKLWLGSVSHSVAAHSHCSVEIVRIRHEQ